MRAASLMRPPPQLHSISLSPSLGLWEFALESRHAKLVYHSRLSCFAAQCINRDVFFAKPRRRLPLQCRAIMGRFGTSVYFCCTASSQHLSRYLAYPGTLENPTNRSVSVDAPSYTRGDVEPHCFRLVLSRILWLPSCRCTQNTLHHIALDFSLVKLPSSFPFLPPSFFSFPPLLSFFPLYAASVIFSYRGILPLFSNSFSFCFVIPFVTAGQLNSFLDIL